MASLTFLRRPAGRLCTGLVGGLALSISLATAALAGDPFRPSDPHDISDVSESVFEAMFVEGDYPAAQERVAVALAEDPQEPMIHAIAAALAYLEQDWDTLERQALVTQTTAEALEASDPLRGHLYSAVGLFLEGAHVLQTRGITRGTPVALRTLQRVFAELDNAEDVDPNDPELSLLKGFMDLLLAVNLPFADPDQAIARLQQGYPEFLAYRGIAIGLRDLGRYGEALTAVDRAIAAAPENPDLLYLKAQILRLSGDAAKSLPLYDQALAYADQLPASTVRDITFEQCLVQGNPGPVCSERATRL